MPALPLHPPEAAFQHPGLFLAAAHPEGEGLAGLVALPAAPQGLFQDFPVRRHHQLQGRQPLQGLVVPPQNAPGLGVGHGQAALPVHQEHRVGGVVHQQAVAPVLVVGPAVHPLGHGADGGGQGAQLVRGAQLPAGRGLALGHLVHRPPQALHRAVHREDHRQADNGADGQEQGPGKGEGLPKLRAQLAVHGGQAHGHVQHPQDLLLGRVGVAGWAGADGLVVDGQDGAQHPAAPGFGEDAGALLEGQAAQGGVLGVAHVAGLGLEVHRLADLGGVRGEHDDPVLVEHSDQFDVRLGGHVVDDAVQALTLVVEHGPVSGPAHRLHEALGLALHPLQLHALLLLQVGVGRRPHRQEGDQPHREGQLEAERMPQTLEYAGNEPEHGAPRLTP